MAFNKEQLKKIKALCKRFKRDTQIFSQSNLVKKHGSTHTMIEIEELWFDTNLK